MLMVTTVQNVNSDNHGLRLVKIGYRAFARKLLGLNCQLHSKLQLFELSPCTPSPRIPIS